MTDAARQPKDENYNLIAVLYQSSDNVGSLKVYIQNAQHEATRNSSSSSAGSWRTTFVWHSGPRRCSFPRFQGKQELRKGLFCRARGLRVRVPSVLTPTQKLPARSHFIRRARA